MSEERPMSAGVCCRCGCRIWLTPSHYYAAMEGRSKIIFHCGYGHPQHFCDEDDEITKIRRERDRLKQQMAQREDMIANLQIRNHDLLSKNDKLTKESGRIKRRAAAGTCPCCNRTFRQLAAHMKTKHPQWERFGEVA